MDISSQHNERSVLATNAVSPLQEFSLQSSPNGTPMMAIVRQATARICGCKYGCVASMPGCELHGEASRLNRLQTHNTRQRPCVPWLLHRAALYMYLPSWSWCIPTPQLSSWSIGFQNVILIGSCTTPVLSGPYSPSCKLAATVVVSLALHMDSKPINCYLHAHGMLTTMPSMSEAPPLHELYSMSSLAGLCQQVQSDQGHASMYLHAPHYTMLGQIACEDSAGHGMLCSRQAAQNSEPPPSIAAVPHDAHMPH